MNSWIKQGLVYGPDGSQPWAQHTALQPTPYISPDGRLLIYAGFRDSDGISRIGCVELEPNDPSKVLRVSEKPLLDIGTPGDFDDNGVVPCAVVQDGERLRLYYAGYRLGVTTRFSVFGGLAFSDDGGETFEKHANVPMLDRTQDERYFRVAHTVRHEDGIWKAWYGAGSSWMKDETGRPVPSYDVRYAESPDGISFPERGRVCIPVTDDQYRVGRPFVMASDAIPSITRSDRFEYRSRDRR